MTNLQVSEKQSLIKMAPLFLVLFIDSMGLGLLFPILNSVIVDPIASFLARDTTLFTRDLLYGVIVSVFMLCWFFGAAILGDLSDTVGRKKSLMICLWGAFVGYLISAFGIMLRSVSLLIVGRMIAGFTAGSQPIAQAAIVDVSSAENKPRNIGYILLAVSLGFVCGPILGGVLSDHHLIGWFTFSTPLYFAAGISLLNAALLQWLFHETHKSKKKITVKWHHAIGIFTSAFKHKGVRRLSLVLLVMLTGWSSYFSFISMYMLIKYHFDPFKVSMFLAALGVGFSIGCGFLVDFFNRYFKLKWTTVWAYLIAAFLIGLMVFGGDQNLDWILVILIGAAMAVGYSDIITMFSNQVGDDEQGWVMGVTGSILALCFGVTTLLIGFVAHFNVGLPLIIAAVVVAISGFILIPVKVK